MTARKPTLYIIHGWTYTTAPWARTIAMLEKGGVKVQMLNVPGLTTGSKKVWTIEEYAKWADRNLPDGAIALGHSNGGRILLNLCSNKPDKLKQLILLDAAGVYETSTKRDLARTLSKKLGFLKNIPGLTKLWHKVTGSSDYARAPENMKKTLANMLDSDKSLDLTKVTTPTSILWGADDTVTPPRQAEVMHQLLPNNTLEIFPKWTHAPYLSHPNELARAIQKVLRHPPVPAPIIQAAAGSASLALKKAVGPDFKAPKEKPVAPSGVTKLELMSGKASPLVGLVVSDEEGAAVKYETKTAPKAVKPTDVASNSASANFRRARSKAPDLDANADSASATLKKSQYRPTAESTSASSASLVLKRGREAENKSVLAELADQADEAVSFEPLCTTKPDEASTPLANGKIISTASVPKKAGRIERVRRKVQRTKSTTKTKKGQA